MYAEVSCPQCQQRLRVPAGEVGKQAVCAMCQTLFVISDGQPQPSPDGFQAQTPAQNPYAASRHAAMRRMNPHRGGVVLALAIIGWTVCPVLSFVAWFMGRNDISKMNRGTMDGSGRSVTQAGTTLALVHLVLLILGMFAFFFVILVGGVFSLSM